MQSGWFPNVEGWQELPGRRHLSTGLEAGVTTCRDLAGEKAKTDKTDLKDGIRDTG